MKQAFLFVCILFFMQGCYNESSPKKELQNHNFDLCYEGTIGNRPILMDFSVKDSFISGFYYYDDTGGQLRFTGKVINGDSVFFEERELDKVGGRITGTFTGKISQDKRQITGKWYDEEKELAINLKYSNLDYDVKLREKQASKITILNLLKFEGETSLSPILNNKTVFRSDYSKNMDGLEKVIILISVGDQNIKELNKKLDSIINSVEDVVGGVSQLDKKLFALNELLKTIDTQELFNESDGSNARLNTYLVCDGMGDQWRKNNGKIGSYFKAYDNKTSTFKIELARYELPKNGFDICLENPNLTGPAAKFELFAYGLIRKKHKQLGEFADSCD